MATDGMDPPATGASTALGSLSVVALGAVRLVQRWPGLLAVPVSYGVAAAVLYEHSYAYILSAVIAAVVGVGWYASPLRRVEARRRTSLPADDA